VFGTIIGYTPSRFTPLTYIRRTGIDADGVPFVDKEGHMHHGTGFNGGRFGDIGGGVSL
jgi:hypothetical protein